MSSFLERAIRRGISQGLGNAIGKAVQQAVEPKATEMANRAADHLEQAAGNAAQQTSQTTRGLEGAFANLERAAQSYATEMSKNVKICPECGHGGGADSKFCPVCGAKMPEQTLAEGAVCPNCGKQNNIGTKFCQDCGTKLPIAVQEEQMARAKDAAAMAKWDEMLSMYPKWNCGGKNFEVEDYDSHIVFSADFSGNSYAARNAVEQYKAVLAADGFVSAGQYPSPSHLYKMVNGVCYHVDVEHCFEGDSDCPNIGFDRSEPSGGFYYVKPEPKKMGNLFDLFK